jgi:hypothetical protein
VTDYGALLDIFEQFKDSVTLIAAGAEAFDRDLMEETNTALAGQVWSSQGLSIPYDMEIEQALEYDWDAIVIPGGGKRKIVIQKSVRYRFCY